MADGPGSRLCAACGKLVSADETTCPYCGAQQRGVAGLAAALPRLAGTLDLGVTIIACCVLFYLVALALDPTAIFNGPKSLLGFLSPNGLALLELGMTGGPAWQQGWWWTIFTATYLHGGLLHILFNMMWVRELMPPVVDMFGVARAFVIFNAAGAIGFLVSNLTFGAPTIGASGAIFGLLGALVVYGRRRGIAMLTAQAWRYALLLFVFGLIVPAVNNWAHAGGFVGGALTAMLVGTSDQREGRGVQLLAVACAAMVLAGVALSYISVMRLRG